MALRLTKAEAQELASYYGGQPVVVDETATATGNDILREQVLCTGRIAHFVYHVDGDSVSVFKVEQAPPPPTPDAVLKLTEFLNSNPDVKELLGL